jgi:hypothetical protein
MNRDTMTQPEMILKYIKENGSITAYNAVLDLGILQLSARICEMQAEGFVFDKTTKTGTNRYGCKTHWVEYRLMDNFPAIKKEM